MLEDKGLSDWLLDHSKELSRCECDWCQKEAKAFSRMALEGPWGTNSKRDLESLAEQYRKRVEGC